MSNQEVEQYLGQQYARMLKDTPAAMPIQSPQMSEDIRESLQLLGRFNQVALQIKRTTRSQFFFS